MIASGKRTPGAALIFTAAPNPFFCPDDLSSAQKITKKPEIRLSFFCCIFAYFVICYFCMKLRKTQIETIQSILKKHDVKRAHLFGSYSRGEANEKSDIDILFEFRGNKSLFDHSGLKIALEEKLGKKVDLVTYNSLYPQLKSYVMKDLTPLMN